MPIDEVRINFDTGAVWIVNLCLAFIMLGVALNLSINDFKQLGKNPRSTLVGIGSQFILLPALTFLLVYLMKPQPSVALGMMLVAACPGGNISNYFTHLAKGNVALSIGLTAFATLTAFILTPLNFHFWGNMYGPTQAILTRVSVNPLELFKTVGLILLIPLVIGMGVRHLFPKQALWASNKIKVASIFIFFAIVIGAFAKNIDLFLEYIHLVIGLVFLHNLVALLSGWSLSSIFRLPVADRKTLTIETGIQNSGLGLLLTFAFFEDLGGMAIVVAWWGIWHIITGLPLAAFWSRRG